MLAPSFSASKKRPKKSDFALRRAQSALRRAELRAAIWVNLKRATYGRWFPARRVWFAAVQMSNSGRQRQPAKRRFPILCTTGLTIRLALVFF